MKDFYSRKENSPFLLITEAEKDKGLEVRNERVL